MASTVVHQHCPTCGKIAETVKELKVGSKIIRKLKCGHLATRLTIVESDPDEIYKSIVSIDNKRPYPFQIAGIKFAEQANFRMLFEDEPGLGKTLQVLACLKLHQDELLPALIICKAKLRAQMGDQCIKWIGLPAQVIMQNYEKPLNFKRAIVVISYDMIWRMKWDDKVWAMFKTVIIDECQHMKNESSKRTKKIRGICADNPSIKHVMGASGTPVKNNAREFFPFLNLVRPDLFPTETGFVLRYVDTHEKGGYRKYGGIRTDALDKWQDITSKFIIRRKRADVLPDLPTVDRQFRMCDLAEEVASAYQVATQEFIDVYEDGKPMAFSKVQNLLAQIAIMRHLVAISKIDDTIDEIDEVLLGTDEKIVIFAHHIDVQEEMLKKLIKKCDEGGFPEPVWLAGGMSDENASGVIKAFVDGTSRILVASTLAAGEGVDRLQEVCGRCIIHERQWNPANEEQAEGRLTRIGSKLSGTGTKIIAKYMIAVGTIDEWFTTLVDSKRGYMSSTLDGTVSTLDEQSLTREMIDVIAREGRARWHLK